MKHCATFPNCDTCGRFTVPGTPGSSWVQVPDTDVNRGEDKERCAKCTIKHGPVKPWGNYVEALVCGVVGTFTEYQDAMIAHAKEVQGDNYAGDNYYRQECWLERFEDGDIPSDAVDSDMGYWD